MFGDIIKVTPTSKVVGDMAITMVTSGLTREAVLDPAAEIGISRFGGASVSRGARQPVGGFPVDLQNKVLAASSARRAAGELLPAADLEAERRLAESKVGRGITGMKLASYLMYPRYSPTTRPTAAPSRCQRAADGRVLYGMDPGQESTLI